MTDEEIVSLIRNWTVGELSTIQACAGVVADFLARHPREQERLREHPGAVPEAVEEIMRLHDPLVSNRRRARKDAEIAGCPVPAGSRVSLNWTAANRDERAFPEATAYRPGRDQSNNLVYGIGVHACPGAPLARLELRLLAEELLAGTRAIRPAGTSVPDVYPVAGFSSVPVVVE